MSISKPSGNRFNKERRIISLMISIVVVGILIVFDQTTAYAAGITVSTTTGCTINDAVTAANLDAATGSCPAGAGADTISFDTTITTINLATTLVITSDITINGGSGVTIDGGNAIRLIKVQSGNVTIDNITLTNGNDPSTDCIGKSCGGAILVHSQGSTLITNTTIVSNTAHNGGGIAIFQTVLGKAGSVEIVNSSISRNKAIEAQGSNRAGRGGGIFVTGADSVRITDSMINHNVAEGALYGVGGGIWTYYTDTHIKNSTLANNHADSHGGAIFASRSINSATNKLTVDNSSLVYNTIAGSSSGCGSAIGSNRSANDTSPTIITNSTISQNATLGPSFQTVAVCLLNGSDNDDHAVLNNTISGNLDGALFAGSFRVRNNTIVNNTSSSGAIIKYGFGHFTNNIIANNSGGNCEDVSNVGSDNLSSDGSCDMATQSSNINLAPLADNGCLTPHKTLNGMACVQTHALRLNSAAIDNTASDAALTTATDQRGVAPTVSIRDTGAYEAYVSIGKTVTPTVVLMGETVTYTIGYAAHYTLTAATIADQLPAAMRDVQVVSTSGPPLTQMANGNSYTWQAGNLNPGDGGVITVTGVFDAVGTITNTAVITGEGAVFPMAVSTNVPVTVLPLDMSIVKTVSPENAFPGDTVTYTVRFQNEGGGVAQNVIVSDAIPPELTSVQVISSGVAITQTSTNPYMWQVSGVPTGAGGVITVTGLLVSNATTFTNTATISATDDFTTTNNSSAAVVTVPTQFTLIKDAQPNDATDFKFSTTFPSATYNPTGQIGSTGSNGNANSQFENPSGVVVDSNGKIYVADRDNHRIQIFDSAYNYLTTLGTGSSGSGNNEFNTPHGVTVDSSGTVYVADSGNHRVQIFEVAGGIYTYSDTIGTTGSSGSDSVRLNHPEGVAVHNGHIFVADSRNYRIQIFATATGSPVYADTIGTGSYGTDNGSFAYASDIAVDNNGVVYVADSYNNRIQIFDSAYNYLTTIGTGSEGSDNSSLSDPAKIAVDADGNVYVTDRINKRIQIFDNAYNYTQTLGVTGTSGSHSNRFNEPLGIAVDASGNVFVADQYNHRISIWGQMSFAPIVDDAAPDDGDTITNTATTTGFAAGTYTITEQISGRWGVTSVACSSNLNGDLSTTKSPTRSLTFAAGEHITCTYTNQPTQLTLVKDAQPNSSDNFTFTTSIRSGVYTYTAQIGDTNQSGGSNEQLSSPRNIAVDKKGNLYVADSANHRIQIFDSSLKYLNTIGTGSSGSENTELNYPFDVAVDSNGNVYVADTNNNRIQIFNSSYVYSDTIGVGAIGSNNDDLAAPVAVTVDGNDNIYIIESYVHKVYVFDSSYSHIATLGTGGDGGQANDQFAVPSNVAVDNDGNIYVADTANQRVQIFNSAYMYIATMGTGTSGTENNQFNYPNDIEVDANGDIYVADTSNNRIQVFDRLNNYVATIGTTSSGTESNQLRNPYGMALGTNGEIYVADSGNHRVSVWNNPIVTPVLDDASPDDGDTITNTFTTSGFTAGVYTVTEQLRTGWSVTDVTCNSNLNGDLGATTSPTQTLTFAAGEHITCTYTNSQPATITIKKETLPSGATDTFSFTGTISRTGVTTTTGALAGSLSHNQTISTGHVAPGTFAVTETVPNGWRLSNIACTGAKDSVIAYTRTIEDQVISSSSFTDFHSGLSIDLKAGEHLTCTFTNEKNGQIIIQKETVPDGATDTFSFTGDVSGSISDGQQIAESVAPGTYTVTESISPDWKLTSLQCNSKLAETNIDTRTATVDIIAGSTITCTFTNELKPDVTVSKTSTKPSALAGDNIVYVIGVTNTRGITATNVVVSDTLPAGLTVTNVISSGLNGAAHTQTGQTLAFNIGSLAPNASGTITVTAATTRTIAHQQVLINSVTITSTGDVSSSNNKVSHSLSLLPSGNSGCYTFDRIELLSVESTNLAVYNGSVEWGDYDGDGDLDFAISGQSRPLFGNWDDSSSNGTAIFINNNGSFNEAATLVELKHSDLAWGDYDGDGDLDLIVIGLNANGDSVTKLYKNDGVNGFVEDSNVALEAVANGSVAWADFDNDGDIDLMLTGLVNSSSQITTDRTSLIYENDGSGNLSELQHNWNLPNVAFGDTAWGDYDGDGDLDLIITGVDSNDIAVAKLYVNNQGQLTDSGESLYGVMNSSSAWGDYDGDGDLDLVIAGEDRGGYTKYTKLYVNDGDGGLVEDLNVNLDGAANGSIDWGDYDGDGDLDLLVTGSSNNRREPKARLYRNDGNGSFTIDEQIVGYYENSSAAWGDYDGDGDLDLFVTGSQLILDESGEKELSQYTIFKNLRCSSLTIKKEVIPATATDSFAFAFGFTHTNLSHGQAISTGLVASQYYDVSETVPQGWRVKDIECTGAVKTLIQRETSSNQIDMYLHEGEHITCTFVNEKEGQIIIKKETLPDTTTDMFSFTGDVTGTISAGQQMTKSVAAGTYTVTESVSVPWSLKSLTCDDTDSTGDVASKTATINVAVGETVTCTFTNEKAGQIIIQKETVPDGATDTFSFTGDVSGSISDGQQITKSVAAGTYTVTESVSAPWSLKSLTCDDTDSSGDVASKTATIKVDAGETVTCTFTNEKDTTVPTGTIVIEKQTLPDGATDVFSFMGAVSGSISDGQRLTQTVAVGTHTVSETVSAPWTLKSLTCDDTDSTGDVASKTATIKVAAGETVTCTFTNEKAGQIIIQKETVPDGATDTFSFTGDVSGSISDGQQITKSVAAGTYTVTESVSTPWSLKSLTCNDTDSTGDVASKTATIKVDAGETVTCTFTNEKDTTVPTGTIVIEKQTLPDGAADDFSFMGAVSGSISDGQRLTQTVTVGTHTVSEMVTAPWSLKSISCNDDDSTGDVASKTATIKVAVGETVICVFTNEQAIVEPPVVNLDHALGAPGSRLSGRGCNYPANSTITISVTWPDGSTVALGTKQSDANGCFDFALKTSESCDLGDYTVTAAAGTVSNSSTFTVDNTAPLITGDGVGGIVVPGAMNNRLFLPVMTNQ